MKWLLPIACAGLSLTIIVDGWRIYRVLRALAKAKMLHPHKDSTIT